MSACDFGRVHSWTSRNQFRTSYRDMSDKSQANAKSMIIPGYTGFVPGDKSTATPGRSLTQLSRNNFEKAEALKTSRPYFVSKGFFEDQKRYDPEVTPISTKHGGNNYQRPRSTMNDPVWTSTSRLSYRNPVSRTKPTARARTAMGQAKPLRPSNFENNVKKNNKPSTRASGFACNTLLFYQIQVAYSKNPGPPPVKLCTSSRAAYVKPTRNPYLQRLMQAKQAKK